MPGCAIGPDGLMYRDGKVVLKGNAHYRTWVDDHGGLAGDYPIPAGMNEAEVGNNAVAVILLTEAAKQEGLCQNAYEVGVIPQVDIKTGEVTYSLAHDFFNRGYGLETYVGETKTDANDQVIQAHGDFMMRYQMAVAKMAAEATGLDMRFAQNEDGSYTAVVDSQNVAAQVLQ